MHMSVMVQGFAELEGWQGVERPTHHRFLETPGTQKCPSPTGGGRGCWTSTYRNETCCNKVVWGVGSGGISEFLDGWVSTHPPLL